jgi:hypothetical protein
MSKVTNHRTPDKTAEAIASDSSPHPLRLWRTIPAEDFDRSRQFAVGAYVASLTNRGIEWRHAVAGDRACAVRIAFRMEVPEEIDADVDATMTLLAHCALDGSAAAALVLAYLLRKMPLNGPLRNRLATSWLVRNVAPGRNGITAAPMKHRSANGFVTSGIRDEKECRS